MKINTTDPWNFNEQLADETLNELKTLNEDSSSRT
jgi:hypothetical protein